MCVNLTKLQQNKTPYVESCASCADPVLPVMNQHVQLLGIECWHRRDMSGSVYTMFLGSIKIAITAKLLIHDFYHTKIADHRISPGAYCTAFYLIKNIIY